MSTKVFIKPTKSTKSHFLGAKRFKYKDSDRGLDSPDEVSLSGDISRFPGTKSFRRPKWNFSKNKWDINMEKDELNEFVKACKLKYTSGPKSGNSIESADVYDREDPFFSHRQLGVTLSEGFGVLNIDNPKDLVVLSSFKADKKYSIPGRQQSINARFIISEAEKDVELELKDNNFLMEAISKYMGLPYEKKLSFAVGLGQPVNEKSSPDLVNKKMMDYFNRNVVNEKGKTNAEIFLDILNTKGSSENLQIKALITRAKKASVLRFSKSDGYKFNGEVIAIDDEGMESFLKNVNNRDIMDAIIKAIEEKG